MRRSPLLSEPAEPSGAFEISLYYTKCHRSEICVTKIYSRIVSPRSWKMLYFVATSRANKEQQATKCLTCEQDKISSKNVAGCPEGPPKVLFISQDNDQSYCDYVVCHQVLFHLDSGGPTLVEGSA